MFNLCEDCERPLDALDTCPECGVHHGEPCEDCGRRAYHTTDCPVYGEQMQAEYENREFDKGKERNR